MTVRRLAKHLHAERAFYTGAHQMPQHIASTASRAAGTAMQHVTAAYGTTRVCTSNMTTSQLLMAATLGPRMPRPY
jgi:hypothetical protein